MIEKTLTQDDLRQFTGTEAYYKHPLVKGIVYTDGVRFLAQRAGAYWLIDQIAFLQSDQRISNNPLMRKEFQFWKLAVREDRTATLRCEDGDDYCALTEEISYTDFPLAEINLYVCNGVLLLTSEY